MLLLEGPRSLNEVRPHARDGLTVVRDRLFVGLRNLRHQNFARCVRIEVALVVPGLSEDELHLGHEGDQVEGAAGSPNLYPPQFRLNMPTICSLHGLEEGLEEQEEEGALGNETHEPLERSELQG